MKITIVFPGRSLETARATASMMPLAPCLLAAVTPPEHDVSLVDMFYGDRVDYDADVDVVGITVRTPRADVAYEVADGFIRRGRNVVLGGPHVFAFPAEAKQHATAVAIGEAEELWPRILDDIGRKQCRDYYVCGPMPWEPLDGAVFHNPERPALDKPAMLRRDLLPRARYRMDSLFTTRGCPNHCRFCPVTDLFGGKIRHRPIDHVVAEVCTLGPLYYNVDDSVFGHPQITDQPEENRYYLDLYAELARVRPKRRWSGAGGISAVNYRDGRKILELAAASGLSSISAGLESVSAAGQRQSGAWRKLHYASPDSFDLRQMKDNIRVIQSLGIEVRGFFIIGWDSDTVETYRRTLDLCDECGVVPFLFTLTPMPGSQIYREYLEQGRILPDHTWADYGTGPVVYRHPAMSPQEMFDSSAVAMTEGYSFGRIVRRSLGTFRRRPEMGVLKDTLFTQLAVRKAYRELYRTVPRPAAA